MSEKKTTEQFIEGAKRVHGDRYDYSKTVYDGAYKKVIITCPVHGDFEQAATVHLSGCGCPKCSTTSSHDASRLPFEEFLRRAREAHGNKYDYSKVEYKNNHTRVVIVCPRHGEFKQAPSKHWGGRGCPKCPKQMSEKTRSDREAAFLRAAKKLYGDKYDFSRVVYKGAKVPVEVVCPKHGPFLKEPGHLLAGKACKACEKEKRVSKEAANAARESFVEGKKAVDEREREHKERVEKNAQERRGRREAKEAVPRKKYVLKGLPKEAFLKGVAARHGDKYDLSNVKYENLDDVLTLKCPKHGEFNIKARDLFMGSGCPSCRQGLTKGEKAIADALDALGVGYEREKSFGDLRERSKLRFDFYVPSYDLVIEYHGVQHYEEAPWLTNGDPKKALKWRQYLDAKKKAYCRDKGMGYLEIPYWEFGSISTTIAKELLARRPTNSENSRRVQGAGIDDVQRPPGNAG